MDDTRLDVLARTVATSRRGTFSLLLGTTLGLGSGRYKSGAKRKKPKKASFCLNGQTHEASKKKKKALLKQGATPGACLPGNNGNGGGTGACPAGQKACNGACISVNACCTTSDCDPCLRDICIDGTCACSGGMARDGKGVCSFFRSCISAGQTAPPGTCCSGVEVSIFPGLVGCLSGNNTCQGDIDCVHGQHCVGNLCAPTYVNVVGDQCAAKAFDICSERTQCTTGLCEDNLCKTCTSNEHCGQEGCLCREGLCINVLGQVERFGDCSRCPAGTVLCNINGGFASCYPPCGKSL